MLLIPYHILYTFPLSILFIFFYVHACKYLSSRYGKQLYVPEGTLTVRDSDLYLYIPEGIITVRDSDLCHVICDPNGAVYT